MEPFITHSGRTICLYEDNVDTDQILPKQFMKRIESTGYGDCLFFERRRGEDGTPDPNFILNQPGCLTASILVTGENFGCGSARQHAVWALRDFGFKVLIGPSFSGTFYVNCFNFAILPAIVHPEELVLLLNLSTETSLVLTIDLPSQTIRLENGIQLDFEVPSYFKNALVTGMNQIDITMEYADVIARFESCQQKRLPWIWTPNPGRCV